MNKSVSIIVILICIVLFSGRSNSQLNWNLQNSGTVTNFWSMYLFNSDKAIVVGDQGNIYKTTNGGLNWNYQFSGTNFTLYSIVFAGIDTGYIGTGGGTILKTINGGNSWNIYPMIAASNITPKLCFVNSQIGYAICRHYVSSNNIDCIVLKTTDGAATWVQQISIPLVYKASIIFSNINTGYFSCFNIANTQNYIYKTINGGTNWDLLNSTIYSAMYDMTFVNSNTGYTTGIYGAIYKTIDGGNSWILQSYNADFSFTSISFVNQNTGFVTGFNGSIWNTTNGGTNWIAQQNLVTNSNLWSMSFSDANTGFAVGNGGTIIKTTTGGNPIGIQQISSNIPAGFYLSQNYPNPFNPSTTIKFDIISVGNGRDRSVKLVIYDVLGKEIATLINQQMQPGSYSVDWDGTNYPSGVYFYKLESGEFVQTKKMVLVK